MRLLDDLHADLTYAARTLRRNPGFAIVAIVSLALGVGANTLVFSILNALVLRPLPVQDPEGVVFVETTGRGYPTQSFPNYRDLRDRNRSFAGLVGYRIAPMNLDTGSGATRIGERGIRPASVASG